VLYIFVVGVSTDQEDHLKFLFENSEDFSVIPSFGVIPAFGMMGSSGSVPGLEIDPTMVGFLLYTLQ
jgi:3-hydroxyacyl-CoA dehydrogenase/3a,7a,12a-trihydroxy-5b-cholest-24-enoyl-CoA hydratase